MGAVRTSSWKELVSQGEQIKLMLKRVETEEPRQKKESGRQGSSGPSTHPKSKDTMAVETASSPKASPK
jgi:hypothetical protein